MPPSAVRTQRDDHLWKRAKAQAKAAGHSKDYPYINGIFQKMTGAKSMTELMAGDVDVLRKGLDSGEKEERNRFKLAARQHSRKAEEHRRSSAVGGNTMSRWKQASAHEDAQEAHREAAEANQAAITDHGQRSAAEDASAVANTHPQADEVKKSMSLSKAEQLSLFGGTRKKSAGDRSGEGSRGGRVIGHTKSGKPIYEGKAVAAHKPKPPTREEIHGVSRKHKESHQKIAADHFRRAKDHSALSGRGGEASVAHIDAAKSHRKAATAHDRAAFDPLHAEEAHGLGNLASERSAAAFQAGERDDAKLTANIDTVKLYHAVGLSDREVSSWSRGDVEAYAKRAIEESTRLAVVMDHAPNYPQNKAEGEALSAAWKAADNLQSAAMGMRASISNQGWSEYGWKHIHGPKLQVEADRFMDAVKELKLAGTKDRRHLHTSWTSAATEIRSRVNDHRKGTKAHQALTAAADHHDNVAQAYGGGKPDVHNTVSSEAYELKKEADKLHQAAMNRRSKAKKSMGDHVGVIAEMELLMKAANPGQIIGRTADGKEVYAHDVDPLQKKTGGKPVAKDKPTETVKAKSAEDEDDGEGTHSHHKDRALAHLQAAQAHASAAGSAKKTEEAKDHKNVVSAARQASEAAVAAVPVKGLAKSLDHGSLSKALYPSSDVLSWAGQFYGTPLYVEALECLKTEVACDADAVKVGANTMPWSEKSGLSRSAKEAQAAKEAKAYAPVEKQRKALEAQRSALEAKLIDLKLTEARTLQMHKSVTFTPQELRGTLNAAIVNAVQAGRSELAKAEAAVTAQQAPVQRVIQKNNLLVNLDSEQRYLDVLEKGEIGLQSASIAEDGRHRLLGQRHQRLSKAVIAPGEADGPRGGDDRETVARAQCADEMVTVDYHGDGGDGGLPEWFRDTYNALPAEAQVLARQGMRGPLNTSWQKGGPVDEMTIVEDDNPYTRAVIRGGQHGEHQSAIRLAYQGGGRELPK